MIIQSLNSTLFEACRVIPMGDIMANFKPNWLPYCVKYNGLDKVVDLEILRKSTDESSKYVRCITRIEQKTERAY